MNALDLSALRIDLATERDLPQILAIFDAAVRWLIEQGLTGQWGAEPFSQQPALVGRFAAYIGQEALYVARHDAAILGTLAIVATPPFYAAHEWNQNPRSALYLEAFATDRSYAGQGVGRLLLAWAERLARSQGYAWLRLECWAGNAALRRYYRQNGFVECGALQLGAWRGTLFEQQVLPPDR